MTAPAVVQRRWLVLLPNLLTALRLALTIAFPLIDPRWWAPVIVIAALSDLLDGFLARRFNLATWIGALLDAIADKAFTIMVLATFVVVQYLHWWQALMLLSRDVAVLITAAYAAGVGEWASFRRMRSRWFGKITTAFIFALLLTIALWPHAGRAVEFLLLLAAASSLAAGVDYFVQFIGEYKRWKKLKTEN